MGVIKFSVNLRDNRGGHFILFDDNLLAPDAVAERDKQATVSKIEFFSFPVIAEAR